MMAAHCDLCGSFKVFLAPDVGKIHILTLSTAIWAIINGRIKRTLKHGYSFVYPRRVKEIYHISKALYAYDRQAFYKSGLPGVFVWNEYPFNGILI